MAKKTVTKNAIQKGYQDYLLNHGKGPETVRVFTKFLGIDDEAFYRHFGSLKNIETSIWEDYYRKTLTIILKDPDFEEMDGREKHLSFLYTMLELIRPDRSYILHKLEGKKPHELPKELRAAQKVITRSDAINWAKHFKFLPDNIKETTQSAYKRVLSSHTIALLLFWVKDDSGESKDTDLFIEKSTRTVFDIGELPAVDSFFDLSKFFLRKMGFSKAAT
ncbi:MAG: hypothetical protein GDA51_13230 [Ekhidna sp.]|nr:hypothetical protein [Ekhidna sp.]MBC6411408.1 hypothetical protein [Ekhidna sp.]MBC6427395.1 hypothetical protein [Ekhidna sp.]